jgi:nucleotide-binding universal stress UspA family protein
MTTAGTSSEPSGAGPAAPEARPETIIVGVDGSQASESALAWAARYAHATGGKLVAVLAWHYPSAAGGPPVGVAPEAVTSEVEKSRHEMLDKAIEATCGDMPPSSVERKVIYGHPAQVLLDESRNADLLVVGSRGHGGFTGMMLGSISTHCVTHASCAVTVVKHT